MNNLKKGMCSFVIWSFAQLCSAEIIIYDFSAEAGGLPLIGSITVDTDRPMYSDEHHRYASDQIVDAELIIGGNPAGDFAGGSLSHYYPEDMEDPAYASNLALYFSANDMFGNLRLTSYYESFYEPTYGLDAASFLDDAGFGSSELRGLAHTLYVDSERIERRPPASVPEPSAFALLSLGLLPLCLRRRESTHYVGARI